MCVIHSFLSLQNPWNSFLGDCSVIDQYLLDKPILSLKWFIPHYLNVLLRAIGQVIIFYHLHQNITSATRRHNQIMISSWHTGAKINFLSRNYQEFDVWKMWILWKMRFQKCEKCDFRNVNFVKNEILERWIL